MPSSHLNKLLVSFRIRVVVGVCDWCVRIVLRIQLWLDIQLATLSLGMSMPDSGEQLITSAIKLHTPLLTKTKLKICI